MSAKKLQAWYAHGQVWISWVPKASAQPQSNGLQQWFIYISDTPFTDTSDPNVRLLARIFDEDGTPAALISDSDNQITKFTIPDEQGNPIEVPAIRRLFVHTVRDAGTYFYAVTDGINTSVNKNAKVLHSFSSTDLPRPHLQGVTSVNANVNSHFYYAWVDGDEDAEAGRSDFPIMANQYRRGFPHLFMLYADVNHDFSVTSPAVVALHGGGGTPKVWKPGTKKMNKVNSNPEGLFTVAHADYLTVLGRNQTVKTKNTQWLGYRESYNPFVAANPVTKEERVINYTQRRILWVNEWLEREGMIDIHRLALVGYSMGSSGVMRLSKMFPDLWSTTSMYCQGFRQIGSDSDTDGLLAGRTDDLPTNLTDDQQNVIHLSGLSNFTDAPNPQGEYPLTRILCGRNDVNGVMYWDPATQQNNIQNDFSVPQRYFQMDEQPFGFQLYWDGRGHNWNEWHHHWCKKTKQTQRDNFSSLTRYRNDVSYPAFFNHQSFPTQPNQYDLRIPGQDNWGTWGGYHDWDPAAIVDEEETWSCPIYLIAGSQGIYNVDNCPDDFLICSVAIRRRQNFLPAAGTTLYWAVLNSPASQMPGGEITVRQNGDVILNRLKLWPFIDADPTMDEPQQTLIFSVNSIFGP